MTEEKNEKVKEVTEAKIVDIRTQIFEAKDSPTEEVFVKEWTPEPLYVRAMSGIEKDSWERSLFIENEEGNIEKNLANFRGKLLVRVLCSDIAGKIRIFTDADADELGEKSAASLDKCIDIAKKLNGLSEKDQKDLTKN